MATMREPDQTPWQIILPKSCTQADQIACHARSIGLPQQPLTGGERSAAEAVTHAKILQTQMSLGVLYCFKTEQSEVADGVSAKNSFVWVTGNVPAPLQAMDSATGENERACLWETISALPELQRLHAHFPVKLRHSSTDRYSGNIRAERGLREPGFLEGFSLIHLGCDVHKLSTTMGWSQASCSNDISAILNVALMCSNLGGVRKLRDILTALLLDEVRIKEEPRPTDVITKKYREDVYDLFLPLHGPDRKMNMKRRFILNYYLNGRLQSEKITHYCLFGCCADHHQTFSNIALHVVWALLPIQCPILCRKNWLGTLPNLDWVGLMESHHGLFRRLMAKFVGKPVPGLQDSAGVPNDSRTLQSSAADPWAMAIQDHLRESGPHPPQVSVASSAAEAGEDPQEGV